MDSRGPSSYDRPSPPRSGSDSQPFASASYDPPQAQWQPQSYAFPPSPPAHHHHPPPRRSTSYEQYEPSYALRPLSHQHYDESRSSQPPATTGLQYWDPQPYSTEQSQDHPHPPPAPYYGPPAPHAPQPPFEGSSSYGPVDVKPNPYALGPAAVTNSTPSSSSSSGSPQAEIIEPRQGTYLPPMSYPQPAPPRPYHPTYSHGPRVDTAQYPPRASEYLPETSGMYASHTATPFPEWRGSDVYEPMQPMSYPRGGESGSFDSSAHHFPGPGHSNDFSMRNPSPTRGSRRDPHMHHGPHRSQSQDAGMRRWSGDPSLGPPEPPQKPKRRRADAAQLKVLNEVYARTSFPSTEERIELGKQLNMTPRQVQIWFQNRRQNAKAGRGNNATSPSDAAPPHNLLNDEAIDQLAGDDQRVYFHPLPDSSRSTLPLRRYP